MNDNFNIGLNKLNMFSGDKPEGGFYWVKDRENIDNPYIRLALDKAFKYKADAVYFRHFEDPRPPIPQIYIYDYTNKPLNEQNITKIHRKIWSSCQVPLFYVFTKNEIKIFNSFKQPKFNNITGEIQYTEFKTINLIELAAEFDNNIKGKNKKLLDDFSASNFDNGCFWEKQDYRNDFIISKNAYETLITKLRIIRRKVIEKEILPKEITHKLLVMTILLKYLEERKDNKNQTVFPKKGENRRDVEHEAEKIYKNDFFHDYARGAHSFVEVLDKNGDIVQLFRDLSKHFNGEIFKLSDNEETIIKNCNLQKFAEFFEGKTEDYGQRTLWRLYSFEDLPIELISNIYEEFIEDKSDGIVYTPPFLVNLLLDEAMPLTDTNTNFKILDPACGSGIFLVQAYKRLIYRWRSKNEWKHPTLNDLKQLLINNIFGVDNKKDAVYLTAFSLTLALCDELSPLVIWNDLKFDILKDKNLFENDFFEIIEKKQLSPDFDLVIGNPPFISRLTSAGIKIEQQRIKKGKPNIPDNQIALLFLQQAIQLCKPNALLCLILPSGPFLYNIGSFDFRTDFLKTYNLQYIFDFTHLSRFLFGRGKGDHPTLAVYVKNEPPTNNDILHLTVRRTKSIKEKIWFELDKYDFHYVSREIALSNKKENKLVWKSNFLGGGRIHFLISRLAKLKTLKNLLFSKKNKGWVESVGFTRAIKSDYDKYINKIEAYQKRLNNLSIEELRDLNKLKNKFTSDYITGKRFLPAQAFTENRINDSNIIHKFNDKYFHSKGKKEIYRPPHLLIRVIVGKKSIPIECRKDYLTFTNQIIGIFAPSEYSYELIDIERRLKNKKLYLFYLAGYSGYYLINKSSMVYKDDIYNLPYPDNEKELDLSEIENILVDDVLDYLLEYRRQHGKVTKVEKHVSETQLEQFAETYLKMLNSIYEEYKAADWKETNSHIIFPFYHGEKSEIPEKTKDLEIHLNQLLVDNMYPEANLRMIRVLTVYDNNIIYLIKPKQLRYWLCSVAIRDADETFAEFVEDEYNL